MNRPNNTYLNSSQRIHTLFQTKVTQPYPKIEKKSTSLKSMILTCDLKTKTAELNKRGPAQLSLSPSRLHIQ